MARPRPKIKYPIVENKNKRRKPDYLNDIPDGHVAVWDHEKGKLAVEPKKKKKPKVKKAPQPRYPADVPEGYHAVWDSTEAIWHYHKVDDEGRYVRGDGRVKSCELVHMRLRYKHTRYIAALAKEAKGQLIKQASMTKIVNMAIAYFLEHTTRQEQLDMLSDQQGVK